MLYKRIRPVLFLLDPEKVHAFILFLLSFRPVQIFLKFFRYAHTICHPREAICHPREGGDPKEVFGISFKNPLGLAAGFDKNAIALLAWELLGFGFMEVGTVTPRPQAGNPKPRIVRFPKQKALLNWMGFPNDGVEKVVQRLKKAKPYLQIPVGLNIGKNQNTPNTMAVEDYVFCIQKANDACDFFVINLSSPNTEGLRELQGEKYLGPLLENCVQVSQRPVLLKLSPDVSEAELVMMLRISMEKKISGFVVSNTTTNTGLLADQKISRGGISGKPLFQMSTAQLEFIKQHSNLPVIASGGIFSKQDADQKLKAGADLVEIYTGLIFKGPSLICEILRKKHSDVF